MGERGRLRTSHAMLEAAMEDESRDQSFVPFYISVANYMEASMGRLHTQDLEMLGRLRQKLGAATPDEEEIIAEVHRRLDGNQDHLKKFLACRNALKAEPADQAAIADFESTSDAYIDYIHNRMGHHAPSTDLARKLFEPADWLEIADLDDDYFAMEKRLYRALLDTRPDCVPLELAAGKFVGQDRIDKSPD